LLFVLFCVLFVRKHVLPPGDNPITVNKYIVSFLCDELQNLGIILNAICHICVSDHITTQCKHIGNHVESLEHYQYHTMIKTSSCWNSFPSVYI